MWDSPASSGYSPITDYEVWWDAGIEDANFDIIGPSTGNALTFTQSAFIIDGNAYTFKVKALNAIGPSDYSLPITVIAGTIPAKALTPVKYLADISTIEIRWDEPNDGGSAITDYKVFWDKGLSNNYYEFAATTDGY